MRRSLGPGAGGPMGGGGMITTHRVVRAGTGGRSSAQEPFPNSTTRTNTNHNSSNNSPTSRPTHKSSSSDNNSNTLSFSSNNHPSLFSSVNHPIVVAAAAPNWANPTSPTSSEEYDWECVGVNGFYDGFDFGTVPSIDEVHHVVSSLQQVLDPPTSSQKSMWEFDWIEPSGNALQSPGSKRVYDAFHLLQTEPSVKGMVVSLSSDKAVWDAVMNNEAVRELRDSVYEASKSISGAQNKVESFDGSIRVSDVLLWIFTNTKAKVVEIVEKITEMVKGLFQSLRNEKAAKGEDAASEPFEKKLRSSFLLTVMVLLIVVVSRVSRS